MIHTYIIDIYKPILDKSPRVYVRAVLSVLSVTAWYGNCLDINFISLWAYYRVRGTKVTQVLLRMEIYVTSYGYV